MRNHLIIAVLLLVSTSLTYGQIPGPEYSQYQYKDTTNLEEDGTLAIKKKHVHKTKFLPKIFFGFGSFNFGGDISDSRNTGIISRPGFKIGFSSNINDFFDATVYMQEGTLRVDGTNNDDIPTNFLSTVNSFGINFDYNFKNIFKKSTLRPFVGLGLSYLRFDSKGSNDNPIDFYEIDLLTEYTNRTGETYSKNGLEIPLSIGVNFSANDRLNLKFGTSLHLTNTDFIDNIEQDGNDSYIVTSASMTYDLFCYECVEDYIPEDKDAYLVNFDVLDNEDNDYDGIKDVDDFCPETPKNVKVDNTGCPIDSDYDAVPDYLDQELNTPKGAVVNSKGIQLTNKMGEMLYLLYQNSSSRKEAVEYYVGSYPSERFVKISKEVINRKGDTLLIDIYKPKVFQDIYTQQKEYLDDVTTSTHIDLDPKITYKIQISKGKKNLSAGQINKLMSIVNLKSTKVDDEVLYTSGEYSDLLEARQKQNQLIISGYPKALVIEDKQADIRVVSEDEMNREQNKRNSAILEDLPPLENIVFRVQIGMLKEVDLDFYDLEDLIVFEGKNGFKHIFSGGYSSYNEALEHRNELYFMSYEEAKVIALKNGELVEAEEYMDYGSEENTPAIFGDVIYKVQLGIFGQNDQVNIEKYNEMNTSEITQMDNGLVRYTTGTFTNIQAAMIKMNELKNSGHENCYVIAFYNNQQVSLKKAQELTK